MIIKKLAIVSSYGESCGNAAFTKVIIDSINTTQANVVAEPIKLELPLMQSTNSQIRKKADEAIAKMAQQLCEYDAVNLQIEAGLYGTYPRDIYRRIKKLISANKNISLTLHSPRILGQDTPRSRRLIKLVLGFRMKSVMRELSSAITNALNSRLNRKIIKFACRNNASLTVHTQRSKNNINWLFGYDDIAVHPLKFIDSYKPKGNQLDVIRGQLGLDPQDILIGIFGYISNYKGHLTALQAMLDLPAHYKLLILGRQHPQTIRSGEELFPYLEDLIEFIDEHPSLKDRVFFLNELDEDSFYNVAAHVDMTWLPYVENGQDGSGICSICMDLSARVVCSSSFAFDELFKLLPYQHTARFDIGNYKELATKTDMLMQQPISTRIENSDYSVSTQAQLYLKSVKLNK